MYFSALKLPNASGQAALVFMDFAGGEATQTLMAALVTRL